MKKLLFFVLLVFAGCNFGVMPEVESTPVTMLEEKTLKVVTTIAPLYSLAANLVEGTNTELVSLIPPRSSVHTFQLKPSDLKNLEAADLVIINGAELEHFLEDKLAELPGKVVDTSVGISLEAFSGIDLEDEDHEDEAHEDEDHDEDHEGHHHGAYDPHVWLDPMNAAKQSITIAEALKEVDGKNSEIYEKNKQDLLKELADLDKEVRDIISSRTDIKYMVLHDAYGYFNRRYNLEPGAVLREFPESEPSPQYLAKIIALIEENEIKVVFKEPQLRSALLENLVSENNLKLGELDPVGASLNKEGYFELIKNLAKNLSGKY